MKTDKSAVGFFLLGFFTIGLGIIMLVFNIIKVGQSSLTTQITAVGGEYIILIGIIFTAIGYIGLSPFGKIRIFFEGGLKKGKRKKRSKSASQIDQEDTK